LKRTLIVLISCLAGLAAVLSAQPVLSNDDVVKLAKSGLSEEFVLNMIRQQPSRFSTYPAALVSLNATGVRETVSAARAAKTPPPDPLTADDIVRLTQAKFNENFILSLLEKQPARFTADAARVVELKQAGVSERVISALMAKGGQRELPSGSEITVRLIDSVDSERNSEGDRFKASLEDPLSIGGQEVAPKGADAVVRLAREKESGKLTGKAELTLELVSVTVNGKEVPVTTNSVTEASGSRGARTAKSAAAVGAVGAIIGAIAGGGRGAAIGAGAGAATGAGAQVLLKGQRVRIASETLLTFITSEPAKF
jgi:hypothetical protein